MSEQPVADDLTLPIKRTDGETVKERLTDNAYHNILPARYLRKNSNGEPVEKQEELFERVAKNIALAEAVFEADKQEVDVMVTPDQLKPDHPRRDELAAEVFGTGVTVEDDIEQPLTEHNVSKFAYETIVPELPESVRDHVETTAAEFQEAMEKLSVLPNSPTLMNAGDELQQLSACFVDSPADDIDDIHQTAKEAAEVFQCLTDDASVAVEEKGVVSVAEVEPGDEIRQRDGDGYQTRTVAETHAYSDAPVHRVTTTAGIELTGTPNHELCVDGRDNPGRHAVGPARLAHRRRRYRRVEHRRVGRAVGPQRGCRQQRDPRTARRGAVRLRDRGQARLFGVDGPAVPRERTRSGPERLKRSPARERQFRHRRLRAVVRGGPHRLGGPRRTRLPPGDG